ncbi:hypothetical protein BDZ91DRAFT_709673 [Kalaharituber pfeilii]|nr:hypothetical protein BDZ91DRAFT_709673 [Kalaharituber pfeilii]
MASSTTPQTCYGDAQPYPESHTLFLEPDSILQDADPLFIQSHEVRRCKITTYLTHARFGRYNSESACFLKYQFNFLPAGDVRFKSVTVCLTFRNRPPPSVGQGRRRAREPVIFLDPVVIAYEPKFWQGTLSTRLAATTVDARVTLSAASTGVHTLSAGAGAGVGGNATMGVRRENSVVLEGRARITSGHESRSSVAWTLTENEIAPHGVPNPFEIAMIVKTGIEHQGVGGTDAIEVDISFRVKLSKSANPLTWVRANARKNEKLVFTQDAPIGDPVEGIENMEQDHFQLANYVTTFWNL